MKRDLTLPQVLAALDADNYWRRFQVDYPEATLGNFAIKKFDIPRLSPGRIKLIEQQGPNRDPGYGSFTKLEETIPGADEEGGPKYRVWMSDTRAEIIEHNPILEKLFWSEKIGHKRVLINGLGLGVAARAALSSGGVDHVDVVENNVSVIGLIGQFFQDERVTIHIADAYAIRWPPGTRWDLVWHDIWPDITDENLPGMDRLMKKYRSSTFWQGCWQRKGCLKMKSLMDRAEKGTLDAQSMIEVLRGRFEI